jgi:hypothetical protein
MSYCRFSSMNWQCDVYVYEDVMGGWTTHVARQRRVFGPIPDVPWGKLLTFGEYDREARKMVYPSIWHRAASNLFFGLVAFWHNKVHMGTLRWIPLRPIGLQHDGASFNDATPGECANRLEHLRSLGYVVPQRAIDALREEQLQPPED